MLRPTFFKKVEKRACQAPTMCVIYCPALGATETTPKQKEQMKWAFGSGGEHFLHTEGVTSSNLVTPTISFLGSSTAEHSAVNR